MAMAKAARAGFAIVFRVTRNAVALLRGLTHTSTMSAALPL
jgi:hypothetical protein